MNEDNSVVEYNSIYEIIDNYFNVRLHYYDLRKEHLLTQLTNKLIELVSKYNFIKGVIDNTIVIANKSDEKIIKQLEAVKNIHKINDSYDYLLNMPMRIITKTHYEKLKEDIKLLKEELNNLKNTSNKDLWREDLNNLKKVLK